MVYKCEIPNDETLAVKKMWSVDESKALRNQKEALTRSCWRGEVEIREDPADQARRLGDGGRRLKVLPWTSTDEGSGNSGSEILPSNLDVWAVGFDGLKLLPWTSTDEGSGFSRSEVPRQDRSSGIALRGSS